MKPTVAVIGVGAIGAQIARRLHAAGCPLMLCDARAEVLAPFRGSDVRIADAPADCATADIVLVLVATPEQAREAVLGARGLRAGIMEGRALLVVLMSTMPSEAVQEIAQALAPRGVRVIDAPVSGGPLAAEQGTLTVMAGGNGADIESAGAVFDCIARQRFHCGALGAGQTTKLVNNVLGIANVVLAGEAYRLALEAGLDLAQVARVLDASSGRNAFSARPEGPATDYAALVNDRASFDALTAILRKDLGLALDMAARNNGRYPALVGLEAIVRGLGDETFEHWQRVAEA